MMNAPYYIKVFEYSKTEKKYKYERDFFPGTIELKYTRNILRKNCNQMDNLLYSPKEHEICPTRNQAS